MVKTERINNDKRHIAFLLIICILMIGVGAVSSIIEALIIVNYDIALENEFVSKAIAAAIFDKQTAIALMRVSLFETLTESVLHVVGGVFGLLILKGYRINERCDIVAIAIFGLATLSALTKGVVFGYGNVDWPMAIFSVSIAVLYMIAVRLESKDFARHTVEGISAEAIAEKLERISKSVAYNYVDINPDRVAGSIAIPVEKVPDLEDLGEYFKQSSNFTGYTNSQFVVATFTLANDVLKIESDDTRFKTLYYDYRVTMIDAELEEVQGSTALSGFLSYVMRNDSALLIDWRERLHALEDLAGDSDTEVPEDFDRYLREARNSLHALMRFYQQLEDMCRNLALSEITGMLDMERARFEVLAGRANRFAYETERVADYAVQIRDLQERITSAKQNEITTVLTIVATVCMSVSLLTSWYGMNLKSMPEMSGTFTYLIVIFVCVIVVVGELIFFKRKKWF